MLNTYWRMQLLAWPYHLLTLKPKFSDVDFLLDELPAKLAVVAVGLAFLRRFFATAVTLLLPQRGQTIEIAGRC